MNEITQNIPLFLREVGYFWDVNHQWITNLLFTLVAYGLYMLVKSQIKKIGLSHKLELLKEYKDLKTKILVQGDTLTVVEDKLELAIELLKDTAKVNANNKFVEEGTKDMYRQFLKNFDKEKSVPVVKDSPKVDDLKSTTVTAFIPDNQSDY